MNHVNEVNGIYRVSGNATFEVMGLPHLCNVGTRDCTAHLYRHEGGSVRGPRGRQVCEMTLIPHQTRTVPPGWVPEGEPLIVEILDFPSDAVV